MDSDIGQILGEIRAEMQAGFARIDNRIDNEILGKMRAEMRAGFNRLDNRIDGLEDLLRSDMAGVNARFDAVDARFEHLEDKMDAGFAKQEKLSHDIIRETIRYVDSHAEALNERDNQLAYEITRVQEFLSDEFG